MENEVKKEFDVIEWVKTHKKEILTGLGTAVLMRMAYKAGCRKSTKESDEVIDILIRALNTCSSIGGAEWMK